MKKQIVILLMACFVMSLFVTSAVAEANICVGDYFGESIIHINVTDADNVGAVDITFEYDPDVVTVVGVIDGDMDTTISNTENVNDGMVRIATYQTSSDGLCGKFVIASVSVVPKTGLEVSSPLEVSVTTFKDATPNVNSIVYTVSNGTYDSIYDESEQSGNIVFVVILVILGVLFILGVILKLKNRELY